MKKILLIITIMLASIMGQAQNTYFVATDGNSSATGTINDPLDILTAIDGNATPMSAGDTLYIRGGEYVGYNFELGFNGTESAPCIVKPYNHETVVIKGHYPPGDGPGGLSVWRVNGDYIHCYNLIITCSPQDRISSEQASSPTDIPTISGTVLREPGTKMINCIVHNNSSTGLNSPNTAIDAEYYGNIVFNNGWEEISNGGTRYFGHGHSLYFQNSTGSTKNIEANIMMKNYSYGIQFYSAGGSETVGSRFIKNIMVMSGTLTNEGATFGKYNLLIDSDKETLIDGNYLYHLDAGDQMFAGYLQYGESIEITNNHVLNGNNGLMYTEFENVTSQYNSVVMPNTMSTGYTYVLSGVNQSDSLAVGTYLIDNNDYYTDGSKFTNSNDFAGWQALGYDANGSFTSISDFTTVPNRVEVIANKYEDKRANIVIYNTQQLSTVSVTIPDSILTSGDSYYLYDVEDMRQPIQQGTYDGNPLQIPTNQTSVFPVIGTEVHVEATHSGDNFGVFLLTSYDVSVPYDGTVVIYPTANFTASPNPAETNETITFTDQSSAGDYSIASRSWNFGDSGTSTATNPTHSYSSAGTYSVILTVTDTESNTDTHSIDIVVNEPTTPGGSTAITAAEFLTLVAAVDGGGTVALETDTITGDVNLSYSGLSTDSINITGNGNTVFTGTVTITGNYVNMQQVTFNSLVIDNSIGTYVRHCTFTGSGTLLSISLPPTFRHGISIDYNTHTPTSSATYIYKENSYNWSEYQMRVYDQGFDVHSLFIQQ